MRKAKYVVLMMLLIAAVLMTSGCQLALDEKEYSRDKLVGISVRIVSGGAKYVRQEDYFDRRQPHEPDGAVIRLNMETDEDGVIRGGAEYDSDWFEPVKLHVHSKDEGDEYTLETTLYLVEDMLPAHPRIEVERVYQREDGSLYALDGGHTYSGHLDGLGLKISESYSETDADGEKSTSTTTLQVWVWYEEQVVSAQAVEMKSTGEEIARHDLTDQEELWVSADAEWLLIEETLADGTIRRSAVNGPLNNEFFYVRFANEKGVCIRHTYKIRTPGALSDTTRPG